jgi:hypothetical protein
VRDLVASSEHRIQATTVDIEAYEPIGEEDGRDLTPIGELGEVGVVLEGILCG